MSGFKAVSSFAIALLGALGMDFKFNILNMYGMYNN